MINTNIVDGEVQFIIDDFARLNVMLYNNQKTIPLLSFNGEVRDLYYRNNSFFRLQDQRYELIQIYNKYENNEHTVESQICSYMLMLTFFLDIYSRYTREIDTLWIGKKSELYDDIEFLIHKFNKNNRILEINNMQILDSLSVAQFACIFVHEDEIENIDIDKLVTLLRNGGELLIWGNKRYETNTAILETIKHSNEIDIWLIDRECYAVRIKPQQYLYFAKDIPCKNKIVNRLRKYAEEVFSYIEQVISDTQILLQSQDRFDAIVKYLNSMAGELNIYDILFNNSNLKYEILEVENALLDLKFQKELYGDDMEYFVENLIATKNILAESLKKNLYEI